MDIEKVKNQFEMVKDTETFVITTETVKWLIEQAEKVEELSKFKKDAETLFQRQKLGFANSTEKIMKLEKENKILQTMLESSQGTTKAWVKKYEELKEKLSNSAYVDPEFWNDVEDFK